MKKDVIISPLVEKAKNYAIECHSSTNHKYGNEPYSFHLGIAYFYAIAYISYIPAEDRDNILAAIWCHDVIEDCRQSYNDVKENTNERVADLVYAVTNEKGKNRLQRENAKYFTEMRNITGATYVKLCDRMANISNAVQEQSRMLGMYKKEHDYFLKQVDELKYPLMVQHMNNLLYGDEI